jgi:hypothetical protein
MSVWGLYRKHQFCHLSWFFRESLDFYLPCSWIPHWTSCGCHTIAASASLVLCTVRQCAFRFLLSIV